MTGISTTVSTGPYAGDGVNTAFPFDFTAVISSDVQVLVNGVVVSPLLYGVVLQANGGTITFTTAPVAGAVVLLLLDPDFTQTSEFENEGAYKLATVNLINRRGAVRSNWLAVLLGQIWPTAALNPTSLIGKFLSWDASGAPIVSSGTGADAGLRTDLGTVGAASLINGAVQWVSSRGVMGALGVGPGKRVSVVGEAFDWEWRVGNYTTQVAADPTHLAYQPHTTIAVTVGCWVLNSAGVVSAASTTVAGIVQLNTMGDTFAGTDALEAVTAANLAQVIQSNTFASGTAAGTANALTLTLVPAPVSLYNGLRLTFKAAANNTIGVTLTVNGFPAKSVTYGGAALLKDALVAGREYEVVYDGTVFQLLTAPVAAYVIATVTNANGTARTWSDGQIEQWGSAASSGNNSTGNAITFPIPFTVTPTYIGANSATSQPSATDGNAVWAFPDPSTPLIQFRLGCDDGGRTCYWFARS